MRERIEHYLLQRTRHSLKGLSIALQCNVKTLYRVRTGNYEKEKPYQTETPSHNRIFDNADFQRIRDTAAEIETERNKPPPP